MGGSPLNSKGIIEEKSSRSICDRGLSLLSQLSPSWARQGMKEGCGEDGEGEVV